MKMFATPTFLQYQLNCGEGNFLGLFDQFYHPK